MDAVLEKPATRFRLEGKLTDKSFYLPGDRFRLMQKMSEGVFHSKTVEGFFFRVEHLWLMESPTLEALKELNLL